MPGDFLNRTNVTKTNNVYKGENNLNSGIPLEFLPNHRSFIRCNIINIIYIYNIVIFIYNCYIFLRSFTNLYLMFGSNNLALNLYYNI